MLVEKEAAAYSIRLWKGKKHDGARDIDDGMGRADPLGNFDILLLGEHPHAYASG